ncbi:hypothetical protein KCU98_g27, partial [Aureobasidium melanogenum]
MSAWFSCSACSSYRSRASHDWLRDGAQIFMRPLALIFAVSIRGVCPSSSTSSSKARASTSIFVNSLLLETAA